MPLFFPVKHSFHANYRSDIDGLRAIAIIFVVLFHAFPEKFPGGFVGVDVFFVISGFLISNIIFLSLQADNFSFTDFYAHRIRRIFPAMIVVLTASYTFGWYVLMPDEFKQLGRHVATGAGFIHNFVLWNEAGYFNTASEMKPLLHLWSLSIEEQFYLIYPVLLWFAWRVEINLLRLLVFLIVISFGLNVIWVHNDAVGAFFLPQTRFWEFLVGSVSAYFHFLKPTMLVDWIKCGLFRCVTVNEPFHTATNKGYMLSITSIIGLLAIILAVFAIHKGMLFPGWWALAPVFGTALLIISGPNAWVNRRILSSQFMIFIGLISYPLYLWHWPILSFVRIVESGMPSREIRIIAVGISAGLAWLTYRIVECPIRFGHNQLSKTTVPVLLLALIGFIGLGSFQKDGHSFPTKVESDHDFFSQLEWGENDSFSDECRKFVGQTDLEYCLRTPGNAPDAVLIGDSHANSLYPGLSNEYSKVGRNLILLGAPGCPPFFDTSIAMIGGKDINCQKFMNPSLDYSVSTTSVKQIILSVYAMRNMQGDVLGNPEAKVKTLLFSHGSDIEGTNTFKKAFEYTLTKLIASGKKIYVVIDWPELGFDPRFCHARPVRIQSIDKYPCSIERNSVQERTRQYNILVDELKLKYPTVKWLDPYPYLCDPASCTAMPEGRLAYRDGHHLSKFGSGFVAKKLSGALLDFSR